MPSPVRGLEVGLALAYGAVVGSWLPVTAPAPFWELPAAVVTSPLPSEPAAAEPERAFGAAHTPVGGPRGDRTPPAVSVSKPSLPESASPMVARGADTLPAAPRTSVTPLAATGLHAARPPRSAVRALAADPGRRTRAECPAIIAEGDPVRTACRRASGQRPQSACPAPGGRSGGGPVLCIRAED